MESANVMKRIVAVASGLVWAAAILAGLWISWGYENTPGIAGVPPSQWPADSEVQLAADRATLVMLAHPHCPCSRASIDELSLLMTRGQGRVTAYVLFVRPAGLPDGWEKSDLWHSAAAIPGVNVLSDAGGVEARRFQATTSGDVVLYDSQGRLLFSGGITGSRGHSGDNVGRSSIVALLTQGTAERTQTFVFGCPLLDSSSKCDREAESCNQ
ncbi:MAG TPA: RedB protein [Blastocatellia bacterium]|nr:RedB protein [Blastocatellia bacterium]